MYLWTQVSGTAGRWPSKCCRAEEAVQASPATCSSPWCRPTCTTPMWCAPQASSIQQCLHLATLHCTARIKIVKKWASPSYRRSTFTKPFPVQKKCILDVRREFYSVSLSCTKDNANLLTQSDDFMEALNGLD